MKPNRNQETEIDFYYREKYKNIPLENLIVFRSGPHASSYVRGMDFSDNARALCLAKYIFMTDAYGFARNARKDQIRAQLWHGCGFKTRVNFVWCEKRYEYTTVISDYSSAAVDYLLLDRPIGFTLEDMEAYEQSRGFVFDHIREWLPGVEIFMFEQFCTFIEETAAGTDTFQEKRRLVKTPVRKSCQSKSRRKESAVMQFELMASMMCANYGHLEKEVQNRCMCI